MKYRMKEYDTDVFAKYKEMFFWYFTNNPV